MIRKKGLTLLVIGSVLFSNVLYSQNMNIQADKDNIKIGEPVKLTLSATEWGNQAWPIFPEVNNGIELVEAGKVDTVMENGATIIRQDILVSAYDSGVYQLPSAYDIAQQTFIFNQPLKVSTVDVDTTAPYMPEKGMEDATLAWYESPVFLLICALLILAALVYLFYKIFRKKKPVIATPPPVVKQIPLDIKTYEAIDALVAKRWHETGSYKIFYSELSEIIRQYIEERFKIPALESTTQEVLQVAKRTPLLKKHREPIKKILRKADLVKFAKADAHLIEMQEAIDEAKSFVQLTFRKTEEHVNE